MQNQSLFLAEYGSGISNGVRGGNPGYHQSQMMREKRSLKSINKNHRPKLTASLIYKKCTVDICVPVKPL
jgi:hypothetical protein